MAYPFAERLRHYREEVFFALEVGEGPTLQAARERLARTVLSSAEQAELADIDRMVVSSVMYLDEIEDYLIKDDKSSPLDQWWWHLGKIRAGTYPADLLPPHLRAVYASPDSGQKAA